ncbi:hypothetical protein KCP75_25040 [Salmonella enterica subsp. enterica]|nr:hypothetical protein KCP75_25040 [Salmonella enterica subsp. enterica]
MARDGGRNTGIIDGKRRRHFHRSFRNDHHGAQRRVSITRAPRADTLRGQCAAGRQPHLRHGLQVSRP